MSFFSIPMILIILTLLCSLCFGQKGLSNTSFQIGVVLDLDSRVGRIGSTSLSLALSDFYGVDTNRTTRVVLHVRDSKRNVTDAAAAVLDLLRNVEVDAIIGPQQSGQASFVISLGDAAKVPIVSFSATNPSLHPRSPYFIQACMSDSAQVHAIAAIVSHFGWNRVILIHEDSDYGNGIVPYLANALHDVNARISYKSIIPVRTNTDFMQRELSKMNNMQTRVFLVHASAPIASEMFLKAKEENMMREGFVWIVTSSLMDLFYSLESHVVDAMQGVIGVMPSIPTSREFNFDSVASRWKEKFQRDHPNHPIQAELGMFGLWAYNTLWTLATAVERVRFREPTLESKGSSRNLFSTRLSQTGPKILDSILQKKTGELIREFNLVDGKLMPSSFRIMNVDGKERKLVGNLTSEQRTLNNINARVADLGRVVWPGNSTTVPKGWEIPLIGKKLKIGVPVEAPASKDPTDVYNFSEHCRKRFDLVVTNMPYSIQYDFVEIVKHQNWTYDELPNLVSRGELDGAVGDITITAKRSEIVDFTLPFAPGGITMICRIDHKNPNDKWIFLKPFTRELWLTSLGFLVLLGLALWVLEHRINIQFRGLPAEHAGMLLYFPFMSLFHAQRERLTSNFARLVVVVWMLVVLALNSAYTASLSARITVEKLKSAVDIEDLKTENATVGCRRGSFTVDFLKKMGFDNSSIKQYDYPDEIEKDLELGSEKGGIKAFFSVLPYAKFLLNRNGLGKKYMKWGRIYSTEGFAFVFPKDSPLVPEISRAIIRVTGNHSNSTLADARWERDTDLAQLREDQITISLKSFAILFGITVGIALICLIISLSIYLYENRDSIRRILSSEDSVRSKLGAICKHFDQRDPKSFRSSASGEESPSPIVTPIRN